MFVKRVPNYSIMSKILMTCFINMMIRGWLIINPKDRQEPQLMEQCDYMRHGSRFLLFMKELHCFLNRSNFENFPEVTKVQ